MTPKLTELKLKTDVRETIEEFLKESDKLEAVLLIGVDSDGAQQMRTSNCSGYQKSYMVQFINAWMAKWFNIEDV